MANMRCEPVERTTSPERTNVRLLAVAHGAFMVATGMWPLASMKSFQAVTGPKADLWLVKTVGCLLTLVGLHSVLAARTGDVESRRTGLLAFGVSSALASISFFYSVRGRISKIYLLDTLMQTTWALLWLRELMKPPEDDAKTKPLF